MGRLIKKTIRVLVTLAVVAVAGLILLYMFQDYLRYPWTRDGQVNAYIIQITPRVSGPIVRLPIKDNQTVKKGDLLFQIDPRTFAAQVAQARADLDNTYDNIESMKKQVEAAKATVAVNNAAVAQAVIVIKGNVSNIKEKRAEFERMKKLVPRGAGSKRDLEQAQANFEIALDKKESAEANLLKAKATLSQAQANLAQARANLGAPGEQNAKLRSAWATLRQAELNLEFTQVKASVDGYVTNLELSLGSQAVANQPMLALVDVNSFWVYGFFKETLVEHIQPSPSRTAAPVLICCPPSTRVLTGSGWPSVSR